MCLKVIDSESTRRGRLWNRDLAHDLGPTLQRCESSTSTRLGATLEEAVLQRVVDGKVAK